MLLGNALSSCYPHTTCTSVQGYKQRRGFIIAQAPIKSTCRDFWKMVYEKECGVIVMLSDLVENGEVERTEIYRLHILLFNLVAPITLLQEVCYQYWPADDTKGIQKYGEFTVSVLQTTKQNGFIQCIISITNPKVMDSQQYLLLRTKVHQAMSCHCCLPKL